MRSLMKTLSAVLALSLPTVAQADGQYDMYTHEGERLGVLEIVRDISPDFVLFKIDDLEMNLYVPPEAAYVTIDTRNPWIDTQARYQGSWVTTDAVASNTCGGEEVDDHDGIPRKLWGDLVWTNTALDDDLNITFTIDLSACGGEMTPWVISAAPNSYAAGTPTPPVGSSCMSNRAQAIPPVARERATEAEASACSRAGGSIKRVGIRQGDACVLQNCDAFLACSDSSQCVGRCLAEGDFDAVRGEPVAMSGVCQPTTSNFGCTTEIENGYARVTLCLD